MITELENWQDRACNVDSDVGLRCTAEAHSPPPSRLLTEEEDGEEEGHVFILALRILKIEALVKRQSCR